MNRKFSSFFALHCQFKCNFLQNCSVECPLEDAWLTVSTDVMITESFEEANCIVDRCEVERLFAVYLFYLAQLSHWIMIVISACQHRSIHPLIKWLTDLTLFRSINFNRKWSLTNSKIIKCKLKEAKETKPKRIRELSQSEPSAEQNITFTLDATHRHTRRETESRAPTRRI